MSVVAIRINATNEGTAYGKKIAASREIASDKLTISM